MKFKKIIIFLLASFFLYSCTGVQDAFQGKKRSENSDEFLVEKKNPLTVPPDINELPVPLDQEESKETSNSSSEIIEALQGQKTEDKANENNNKDQKSLEQSVLEKINE